MCDPDIITFCVKNIKPKHIKNKRVLEVGSFDVNGSVRDFIEFYKPKEYIGTDILKGKNVDLVLNVYDLYEHFGKDRFDLIICTEVMEHVKYWRSAILNMLGVLKKDGYLLITSPVPHFAYHGYPYDYWRYTPDDFKFIFGGHNIIETNESHDGNDCRVYLQKKKHIDWPFIRAIHNHKLYNVVAGYRKYTSEMNDWFSLRVLWTILPHQFLLWSLDIYKTIFAIGKPRNKK